MASPPADPAGFDRVRADAFAARFLAALIDAALCLMVSVGHRTGRCVSTERNPARPRYSRVVSSRHIAPRRLAPDIQNYCYVVRK